MEDTGKIEWTDELRLCLVKVVSTFSGHINRKSEVWNKISKCFFEQPECDDLGNPPTKELYRSGENRRVKDQFDRIVTDAKKKKTDGRTNTSARDSAQFKIVEKIEIMVEEIEKQKAIAAEAKKVKEDKTKELENNETMILATPDVQDQNPVNKRKLETLGLNGKIKVFYFHYSSASFSFNNFFI